MPYYSDSDTEAGRRRSWSDVSDLVNEEVGKGSESCQGCMILFLATATVICCYSVMSSVT